MSLIPYSPREGREIVLRHREALVVRDPSTQRLEIRSSVRECPTCHQPLGAARATSPDRHFETPTQPDTYVSPDYFRMLQAGYIQAAPEHSARGPPSPVRRLTQPALPTVASPLGSPASSTAGNSPGPSSEFLSSSPAPREGGARIRRDAFSPNYFERFFEEERVLGKGGKGVVLLVRHLLDGVPLGYFACKRVPVGDDHAWLEKVLIEVELLAKLSHPNLVSYRHVWLEDVHLHRFGPSVACAFILQQYCNKGDLLIHLIGEQPKETTKEQLKARMRRRSRGQAESVQDPFASQRRLSLEEIYPLFKDITSGLAYLHSANYIHRDLKPSNCLLHHENGKLTCLISDFGEVQPGNTVRNSTGTTGTISYCAPEVLKMGPDGRFGNFTTKSDIFSLGMILYFLCFGRLPYANANVVQEELEDIDQLRAEISDWKGFLEERKERPDLPLKLYQLLKKMLALDPMERPSAAEVLTVMSHESTNFGGGRTRSSSANPGIGLHNRRVQNLDSPMPPSTPVGDPIKHTRMDSPIEDEFHDIGNSQAQAMALTRSRDGYRGRSISRLGAARLEASIHSPKPAQLLPAPPTNTSSWGVVTRAYQRALSSPTFLQGFRLVLFSVKLLSLGQSCWPYMISVQAVVPLVSLAALDVTMPLRREDWGFRASTLMIVLHFMTLWVVTQWGTLCARPDDGLSGW